MASPRDTDKSNNRRFVDQVMKEYGFPGIAIVGMAFVCYTFLLVPARDHQASLIRANIESQKSLTHSTEVMSTAIDKISNTMDKFDESVNENRQFMQSVNSVHEKQLETMKESNEILHRAEKSMSEVPAERRKQTALLEEIRDKLPSN